MGYYKGYVKDFSRKVKPLYDLIKEKGDGKDGKVQKDGKNSKEQPEE